jgi:hypothetical protein
MLFHIIRGALIGIVGAFGLMLTLVYVMTSEASAQTAACQSRDSLVELLRERYAERPAAAGLEATGRLIELFTSADNDSWTMVMTMPAGESCVIAVGEYWLETKRPVIDGPAA